MLCFGGFGSELLQSNLVVWSHLCSLRNPPLQIFRSGASNVKLWKHGTSFITKLIPRVKKLRARIETTIRSYFAACAADWAAEFDEWGRAQLPGARNKENTHAYLCSPGFLQIINDQFKYKCLYRSAHNMNKPPLGIEPRTFSLQDWHSTTEL